MSQTKAQLIDAVDGSIVTADIADDAVNADKLASNSVVSASIVDGSIVNADINASAAIAGSKISPDFGSQNVVTTGTLGSGDISITGAQPGINFIDSDNNPDFLVYNNNGILKVYDSTNSADRIQIQADGTVDILGNLDAQAGLDVTGAITSTGDVTITSTQPKLFLTDTNSDSDYSLQNANGNIEFVDETNSATRMRIISTGSVGIGINSPDHLLSVPAANSATPRIGITNPDNDENFNISSYHDSSGIYVRLGSNAKFDSSGNGAVDTTAHKAAAIDIDGRNHGRISFVCGDSGGVPTTRATVDRFGNVTVSDGNFVIGTAGHGIDFSAQTATSASGATTSSELLDHYEEGTFTPFNPSLTASDLQGHYTRVGRVVHCSIYITIPSNSNGNAFVIDGLPFNTFNPDPSVGASLQGGYVIYSNYSAAVLVRTNQGGDRIVVNSIGGSNILLTSLDNINFRIGLHYFTT